MLPRNFVNRVLSDSDAALLPAIEGIDSAPDMSIHDALLYAWRGCSTLQAAMPVASIDVRPPPFLQPHPPHSILDHRHRRPPSLHEPHCA